MKSKAAIGAVSLSIVSFSACGAAPDGDVIGAHTESLKADKPMTAPMKDATGTFRTFSTTGSIDNTNAFFQSLGTNGRGVRGACHRPEDGVDHQFQLMCKPASTLPDPREPIHLPHRRWFELSARATLAPSAARRQAYGMLLTKGVIRVGLPHSGWAAEGLELAAVDDPYGFASAAGALSLSATLTHYQSRVSEHGDVGPHARPSRTPRRPHASRGQPIALRPSISISSIKRMRRPSDTPRRPRRSRPSSGSPSSISR